MTAMDHFWFHHIILFPEPTSSLVSKTLKPTSSSLSLSSPLDEILEELPSPLEDEVESSDSSPVTTPLKDDSCNDKDEEKEMNLKERQKRLNLIRGRNNRSKSSSPSTQKGPKIRQNSTIKLQKSMSSRSLMELEIEEVKGFMDLGFRFNKEHLTPRIISVLPGLQRDKLFQVAKDDEIEKDGDYEKGEMRPYLSEAWLIKRPDSPLLNLKMPRVTAAADMKKHLRFWAKTVASAVQQECRCKYK